MVPSRRPSILFASVVTVGEIRLGIEDMPMGKRRTDLEIWLTTGLPGWFAANLLPVTEEIAESMGKDDNRGSAQGTAAEHDRRASGGNRF